MMIVCMCVCLYAGMYMYSLVQCMHVLPSTPLSLSLPPPTPRSLIMAVVLYFAIGMPVMYYVKGARGLEMIPFISFWKDFPFLVKVEGKRGEWGGVGQMYKLVKYKTRY